MINLASLRLIAPVLTLSGFAFVLFLMDAFSKEASPATRRMSFWTALVGLLAAGALIQCPGTTGSAFGRQMMLWDGLAYFLSGISVVTAILVLLVGESYSLFNGLRMSAYYGLLLLSVAGLQLIAASNDFIMIFIAIELIGVPSFILTGYLRGEERSNEAAIKFFLIGAFSTAMLAYGVSILYGLTGATSISALVASPTIWQSHAGLAMMAVFFIIVSFGFKIALVPFHMWVPDAFDGAPAPIAGYLSVGPKIAGVAIALRVFTLTLAGAHPEPITVLAILAALTMTIANVIGLQQTNLIRLLAYSSIAHMGYILLGLIAGGELGGTGVYIYGAAYLFMNLGVFAVAIPVISLSGSSEIKAFSGLSARAPALAALLVFFIVSLAGLPPTAGFVAKFFVFSAAFKANWLWLVIVAGVNSVISVGYYFKVFHAMYFSKATDTRPIPVAYTTKAALLVTGLATLVIGISPNKLIRGAERLLEGPAPATGDAGKSVVAVGTSGVVDSQFQAPVMPEPSQQ